MNQFIFLCMRMDYGWELICILLYVGSIIKQWQSKYLYIFNMFKIIFKIFI